MSNLQNVSTRKAEVSDLELIYQWRNLDKIIALSESRKAVTWDEHNEWFFNAMSSNQHSIHIIMCNNIESGLCRFYYQSDRCELSIYLQPDYYHLGIGSLALNKCMESEKAHCKKFLAYVRQDNLRSRSFFEKNGFIFFSQSLGMMMYVFNYD